MTKKFNLSNKIRKDRQKEFVMIKDIRKFIRKETYLIDQFIKEQINGVALSRKREELAGNKLK